MKCCLSTSDQILLEFDGKISFSRLLTTFWEKRRGWPLLLLCNLNLGSALNNYLPKETFACRVLCRLQVYS